MLPKQLLVCVKWQKLSNEKRLDSFQARRASLLTPPSVVIKAGSMLMQLQEASPSERDFIKSSDHLRWIPTASVTLLESTKEKKDV